jgi:hypothetical protein
LKNIEGVDENDNIYKDTVSKYLKEPDGEKSLTMFIYVLHNKMKRYEEELEQSIFDLIKVKNKSTYKEYTNKINEKLNITTLIPIIKRKHNELINDTIPQINETQPKLKIESIQNNRQPNIILNPLNNLKGRQSFIKK